MVVKLIVEKRNRQPTVSLILRENYLVSKTSGGMSYSYIFDICPPYSPTLFRVNIYSLHKYYAIETENLRAVKIYDFSPGALDYMTNQVLNPVKSSKYKWWMSTTCVRVTTPLSGGGGISTWNNMRISFVSLCPCQ